MNLFVFPPYSTIFILFTHLSTWCYDIWKYLVGHFNPSPLRPKGCCSPLRLPVCPSVCPPVPITSVNTGMQETFSPPPRLNDPVMHHGTCVTCMPGSLTSGFLWSLWRGQHSRHSLGMHNLQFYVSGKRPIPTLPVPEIKALSLIKLHTSGGRGNM